MTYLIIIYLTGFIAAYYTVRFYITQDDCGWDWGDVRMCLFYSIFSWPMCIMVWIIVLLGAIKSRLPDSEPPKWL